MTLNEFSNKTAEILRHTNPSHRLAALRELALSMGRRELAAELRAMEQRRFYMLRTMVQGHDVPDLKAEDAAAQTLIYKAIGALRHAVLAADATSAFGIQVRFQALRPEENLESLISDYLAESERLAADTAVLTDSRRRAGLERIAADIFKHLWVSAPFDDDRAALIVSILTDSNIASYDRRMWTAAIGLGNMPFTDGRRFEILTEVYRQPDAALSVTALCWLLLALAEADTFVFNTYAPAVTALRPTDAALFMLEFQRIYFSIMAGAAKIPNQAELFEKYRQLLGGSFTGGQVDMDTIRRKLEQEGFQGPDATQFEAMRNIEEGSRRGDYVFFETLRPLRALPFFNEISNHFRPFHADASELAEVTDGGGALLADTIRRVPMLPDGDKFAILLSLAQTPESMRAQALDASTAQFYSAMDNPDIDLNRGDPAEASRRVLINTCLKDMFRHFAFKHPFIFPRLTDLAAKYPENFDTFCEIADIFYQYGQADPAARYYSLARTLGQLSADRFNRLARCVTGIRSERSADILREYLAEYPDDMEALAAATRMLLHLKHYAEAEKYADHALQLEPNNTAVLSALADLYAATDRRDKEIELRYQIDYVTESKDTANGARLALALARNGETDEAIAVFAALPQDQLSAQQLADYAWMLWLSGKHNNSLDMLSRLGTGADKLTEQLAASDARLGGGHADSLRLLGEILYLSENNSEFGKFL